MFFNEHFVRSSGRMGATVEERQNGSHGETKT